MATTDSIARPCDYDAMPLADPREPVLYVRCNSTAAAKALGHNAVDDSWSPKIAAVVRTSMEDGERWARLQLSKLGVSTPRSAVYATKED
ncbi:hypothetical protein WJX81_008448 [Elliptochloris bilobata]|uniref:Uncharacterized protein n=1 Tax=Elliptochloris bilobata TaxID=381761 RepID=A0AAW1SFJ4_9CHLO